MLWTRYLTVIVVLVLASAAAYAFWPESDDPHSVCVRQAREHKDVAFTGQATDEQIEKLCRQILRGEPVLHR